MADACALPPSPADWWDRAACAGLDLEIFFAERGDNEAIQFAKRICGGCPVRNECLEAAMVNQEQHGVWGGLTRKERSGRR